MTDQNNTVEQTVMAEIAKAANDYFVAKGDSLFSNGPIHIVPGSDSFTYHVAYGDTYDITIKRRNNVAKIMELTTRCLSHTTMAMIVDGLLPITVYHGDQCLGISNPYIMSCNYYNNEQFPEDLRKCMLYAALNGCNMVSFNQDQIFCNEEDLKKNGITLRS